MAGGASSGMRSEGYPEEHGGDGQSREPRRIIDFHCHGGDVSRTDELETYVKSGNLEALVLLSLPLAGFPGYRARAPHLNEAVLESKWRLNDRLSAASCEHPGLSESSVKLDTGASQAAPRVYAFGCLDHSSAQAAADQAASLAEAGFDGLKLWEGKPDYAAALGLMPDSLPLAEACREAGRRGMPVICHVADPPEFWAAGRAPAGPLFDELIDSAGRLCAACPETDIVFPHLLFLAGNLERAARILKEAPRAFLDLAPGNYMYGELARNREAAAEFFDRWKKRIIFGTDAFFFAEDSGPGDGRTDGMPFSGDSLEGNRMRLKRLRRFLEAPASEVIQNIYKLSSRKIPEVNCLGLPADVLEAVFTGNARRLLPAEPRPVKGKS